MITAGDKSVFMIVIDRREFLGDGLIPAHTVFWVNENTPFLFLSNKEISDFSYIIKSSIFFPLVMDSL